MKQLFSILAFSIITFSALAQAIVPRVGAGYIAQVEGVGAPVFLAGLEVSSKERFSVSGDFHVGGITNDNIGDVVVNRTQIGFDADVNFYFIRGLQGFYLSSGAFFGRLTTNPDNPNEVIPPAFRASNQAGLNGGLGFSQNVEKINLRVFLKLGNNFYDSDNGRFTFGVAAGYRL